MNVQRAPLLILVLLLSACCSTEIRLAAERYAIAKRHLLIHEWTIVCEGPCSLQVHAAGPCVRDSFIGGQRFPKGEHLLWVQRDVVTEQLRFHHPHSGGTYFSPNVFGGSFRIVEPEGPITRTGNIRLMESYDGETAVFLSIKRQEPVTLKD